MQSLFRTVVLVRIIGFDAWCAAYGRMRHAPTKMSVVVSQESTSIRGCICLLNAVSLRGNSCIKIVLECNPFGLFVSLTLAVLNCYPPPPPWGQKAPLHGQTIIRFLVVIVDYV